MAFDKNELIFFLAEYDDLQHDLSDAEASVRTLNEQNNSLQSQNETLSKQLKSIKSSFEDEIARFELEKAQVEMERDSISERYVLIIIGKLLCKLEKILSSATDF